jgi:1,4-alpha-glucan branching enzyme
MPRQPKPLPPPAQLPDDVVRELLTGTHRRPHDVLGVHAAHDGTTRGVVVRALPVGASAMWALFDDGEAYELTAQRGGLWQGFVPDTRPPRRHRLRAQFEDGRVVEGEDPYRFEPTIGSLDLHLFGEGSHLRLWQMLGAHLRTVDGVDGTAFAVWAPNARGVSVIGDFNGWNGHVHPMRRLNDGGVWELFLPGVAEGARYKFEIRAMSGPVRVKTDPMGRFMEQQPGNASIVTPHAGYAWGDDAWMGNREERDPTREPMLVYEVHLGSWRRVPDDGNRPLTYREIAPLLAEHCTRLGFTHLELMPVLEHPYGASWGYQVSGYFAPTSRYGTPDDFRFLVDTLHQAGIGVLLDWVPAHFPKDDFALRRFDGTACYEHEDPRLAEHPEWGTLIFNYGRNEVRNFLLANALYWIEEFHLDGLRVDAVASMLYLDYGREAGQWMRNRLGGRENLDAVSFLRQLNYTVRSRHPGVSTIAEESTTWPRVTHPIVEGGLGFTFKWNMGWMHDTLDYFRVDPLFRSGNHDRLTFAMMYEYSERFVNPLSHDEVVHLKRSLLDKMPGDAWRKFANLRAMLAYAITRPGKTLLFMGAELGTWREWNHEASLEWHLLDDPAHAGLFAFVEAMGALYREHPCFWRRDHEPAGFAWIDVADREQSVVSYVRRDGEDHAVIVLNLTPVPRAGYRIGAPAGGAYRIALSSDDAGFGGSGFAVTDSVLTEDMPYHGFEQSMLLTLPPLSVLVLLPEPGTLESPATLEAAAAVPVGIEVAVPAAELLVQELGRARRRPRRHGKAFAQDEEAAVVERLVKPAKASKGAKAVKRVRTEKADKPVKPEKPAKAEKPAKPRKPRKRSKPEDEA